MGQPHSVSKQEEALDTMIGLTGLSSLHRAAGSGSPELHLALRRRGFIRVTTTAAFWIPKGQYAVGLVTRENTFQGIEHALAQISQFLSPSATIAALIDTRESGLCLKIRPQLEQIGFRIEAGVRCQQGFVLSVYRQGFGHQGFGQTENAA